jgi:hypothetical protein
MAPFGGFDLRLDPWQVEYGSDLPLGGALQDDASDQLDDLEPERSAAEWHPIVPDSSPLPSRLVFVDGVRRIEARVLARRGDRLCHGAFGSYAVGCVEVESGAAKCGEPEVDRIVVLDSGEALPHAIEVAPGLVYRPVSTAGVDPDAALMRLQEEMRNAEERHSRALADREDTLVVADGPLRFPKPVRGAAVGYIKRVFELYVAAAQRLVIASLPPGSRTPIFHLSARRFARYSWFLRLAAPHAADSELAGIVRLEVADAVGVESACRLADATTRMLPRFAPSRGRDPRAPQNLLPIGALESQLRHRLGDSNLIRRHIGAHIAREARHA